MVTKAADMLHISQPAVTRLLTDLQERAGCPCFERTRGRLRPMAEVHLLDETAAAHAIKTQQRRWIRAG